MDESGFCAWSEPTYSYYFPGQQKCLEQSKRRGLRLSIIGVLQPLISFVYGLVIEEIFTFLGLTQLAYFLCRVCDATKVFERSNETYSVTHQPSIVTLA
jgi:hypothetical protein